MKKLIFPFISAFILFPLMTSAGGWSSGGGGFLKDTRNPWFIGQDEVRYCVRLDTENFGTDLQNVNTQIQHALRFWQSEFSHAVLPTLPKSGRLQIASQKFTEVSCDSDTDLIFQFGVLTKLQRKQFKEPTDYGAVAVRTDYDTKTLRGKGFIYVSPVQGPLAVQRSGVPQDIWERNDGRALFLTLAHELGHVFGLPHGGSFGDLMSEGFVELLLTGPDGNDSGDLRYFSPPTRSHITCPADPVLKIWTDFFGRKNDEKCFQFLFEHEQRSQLFGQTHLRVLSAETKDGRFSEIASGTLTLARFTPVQINILWLPPGQSVFASDDLLQVNFPSVLGVSLLKTSKQGPLHIEKSGTRTLSFEFEQGRQGFSLIGVGPGGELIHLY